MCTGSTNAEFVVSQSLPTYQPGRSMAHTTLGSRRLTLGYRYVNMFLYNKSWVEFIDPETLSNKLLP